MIKRKLILMLAAAAFVVIALNGCETDPPIPEELPSDNIHLVIPDGWPAPNYDFSTNRLTEEGFVLGRKLFYDTKLSRDNSISCASCHQQFAAFSHLDHRLSHGIDGLFGTRNAPGLYNLNWQNSFMWDGGVNHIEVQPTAPLTNPVEMDETIDNVVLKLQNDPDYREMFKSAFGTTTVTSQLMLKAMAQFMGMLVSYNSRYDQYTRGKATLTTPETNGLALFQSNCASCHTPPLFSNYQFANNGLDTAFADGGRGIITGAPSDMGTFRVPSLRNVALSPPYMHDGRFETLQEVLNHYVSGVKNSATLHPSLAGGIALTAQEQNDIIAFLKTLSDYTFINDKRFNDPFQH